MREPEVVIKVQNISKCYRLGIKDEVNETFGGTLIEFLKSPLANYRKYRSLYDFSDLNDFSGNTGVAESGDNILWALRDVSFDVKRGEVLGIVGGNGAGKSTLLKVLSRITPPATGSIEIKGRVSSLLEVGTGFHPELTGRENVYLNGVILGMKKAEVDRKFDEIVGFSGVEKFLDTPVKRYSSGMQVRLAFSVAAHLEPDILIIDEVLAVGDAAFQSKCLGKMQDVAHEGRTVLFVSHNMGAITNLCSSAVWLDQGGIVAQGDVGYIISEYLNKYSNISITDPSQWKRSGSGEARITSARLLDNMNQDRTLFNMGEDISVEFDVEFFHEHKTLPDDLSIMLTRVDMAVNVLHLSSRDCGFMENGVNKGKYRIKVDIPECMLYPGTYNVAIWVAGFDYVQDLLSFQIVQGSVSRRSSPFYPDHGIYYSPSTWNIVQ
ncbi:MAG: ABC transporter ATP-binding protein [Gammaproteobacteria bacterium]